MNIRTLVAKPFVSNVLSICLGGIIATGLFVVVSDPSMLTADLLRDAQTDTVDADIVAAVTYDSGSVLTLTADKEYHQILSFDFTIGYDDMFVSIDPAMISSTVGSVDRGLVSGQLVVSIATTADIVPGDVLVSVPYSGSQQGIQLNQATVVSSGNKSSDLIIRVLHDWSTDGNTGGFH